MSLVQKAKTLADPMSKAGLAARCADLERQVSLARSSAAQAQASLKLAQQERQSVSERLDILLDTQDQVQQRKLARAAKSKSKSSASIILCANDWHSEERIERDIAGGVNEFNLDIAAARIARTWEKCIYLRDFASHISNIDNLALWLGGDLVNGVIHEELAESNFLGPTEAVLWVQDRIAEGIKALLPHFKSITVVTSYGNHGRSTAKRRISTGYRHSWEWLAYHNVAHTFASERRVAFQICRGYHNWLDIQGHGVRFHHGDAVRFQGGIGGLHIPLRRKIAQWNKTKTATLDVIGHFHEWIDDWRYVVSGCLVGHNAYAIEIGAEFQEPTQGFIVMDRQHGKVLAMPIFCDAGSN